MNDVTTSGALSPASAFSLRPYQAAKVAEARALMGSGKKSICLVSPTGSGKCLGKGTPVLMYDGKIKAVEDIRPGDRLMGPDSTPRNVLSVCSGVEMLYRVTPKKGDSYVVNASHILSLKRTREGSHSWQNNRAGDIVNISVNEYLQTTPYFKHLHKGWRTGVEFESRELLMIDPYFLGMWLGDGTQRTSAITTGDQEVIDWIIDYATSLKLHTRIENNSENSVGVHITTGIQGGGSGRNPLVYALDRHGLRQRKHVPHAYKTASRADRLKLLAGFIDADGSLSNGGYDVVVINEELIDDIIFVARSLGFAAYKSACKKTCCNNGKEGNYFRCNIGGNTDEIPCLIARKQASPRRQKKSVLVTGISVEPIGEGDYYGFEIDGDRLFMLGDFTVTHNTIIAAHIIHSALSKSKRVLFLAHRRELIDQCAAKLRDLGIWNYNVVLSGHPQSRNPAAPMQIASIQTLIRREYPPADLVIVDECLTGDTLVSTPNGDLPIQDIIVGSSVMTYNKGTVTESKVTAAWNSGEKEIIKIITQSGVEIKCTKNHLIYTETGWIQAGKITASSKVLLLAHVDAGLSCIKTNGGGSRFFPEAITLLKGLWKNGLKNIKRSWILSRYACAVAEKKQDSVTGLLWKNSLSQKGLRAFVNDSMGMIKGPNSGKWKLPIMSAKPSLEPCLETPVSCIQTTEALTQGFHLITEAHNHRGPNTKAIILSGLEERYQGKSAWVTENSLSPTPLNVCHAWLTFMMSALKTAKKQLRLTGLTKLGGSGWRGGFAMMDQVAADLYAYILRGIQSKKTKLSAIGFQKITGRQRLTEAQGAITGFICQRKSRETYSLSSLPTSRNSCSTNWHQVSCVQTLPERQKVYDITVEGTHCFFANGFLVHNCHHSAAGQYQTLLANYPDAYVLGLTATPERLDGKGLDGIFHDLLEVATVPELIDSGFLVAPTCLGPSQEMAAKLKATLATVKVRCGDYAEGALGEAMDNATLVGDIVAHWQEWAPGQRTIVFAASILHSQHIIQQFQDAGVAAAHLDGGMATPERERILSAWRRGDIQVVSNCQILTEGFDFPELSCCILARPTKSVALFLQMCGRVLRVAPGKSGALILDHAGNILEHGPPHIERVWTLQGASKKRKAEKTHACFLPGCGALFVERDAGAIWWVAATQPGIVDSYRFMARKFERMDRSSADFSQEAKLLICPACSHAGCKFCGSFIQPPSAESHDRLTCPHCQGEYSSDRQEQEDREKRKPPECADGSLVLIDGNSPALEKIKVKNEYHRLLNLAREKGHKRGWVWWRLKEKFSEEQLRAGLPWHKSSWWKQGAAEHGRVKS